jgi:protein SCO1/2
MSKHLLLGAIALLSATLVWLTLVWSPAGDAPGRHARLDLNAPPAGGDFQLVSANGPVRLDDLRGKVVLLYFGYTTCPDICPTNLAIIALALRALTPDELDRVQPIFVSVDPQRDAPEHLADYVAYFHPSIIGVTGAEREVSAVAAKYGAAYQRSEQPGSAMGYLVDHSAYTYLIDANGALVDVLDHATPAEEIVQALRRQLATPPMSTKQAGRQGPTH